jgi:hypothetical protein
MKAAATVSVLAITMLAACTTSGASTTTHVDEGLDGDVYEIVDLREVVLVDAEEDWCNTLEGSAGAWLVAEDLELVVDRSSGEPFTIDLDTRHLLETVASEGVAAVSPDEVAELDTFLRLPIPSPLACKTAFAARNK